jgi:glucan 1,3-beta-glucosidase
MIHNISGNGAGHGPYMSMHDGEIISSFCDVSHPIFCSGFQSLSAWANYMPGSDRLILDSHPYLCFVEIDPAPLSQQLTKPCQMWGALFNSSLAAFGITVAGEWSLSFNDCPYSLFDSWK